jgi:hypothetical protein
MYDDHETIDSKSTHPRLSDHSDDRFSTCARRATEGRQLLSVRGEQYRTRASSPITAITHRDQCGVGGGWRQNYIMRVAAIDLRTAFAMYIKRVAHLWARRALLEVSSISATDSRSVRNRNPLLLLLLRNVTAIDPQSGTCPAPTTTGRLWRYVHPIPVAYRGLSWSSTEAMRPEGCKVVTLKVFNMYSRIRKNLKNCN